jgi:hypothetical protein
MAAAGSAREWSNCVMRQEVLDRRKRIFERNGLGLGNERALYVKSASVFMHGLARNHRCPSVECEAPGRSLASGTMARVECVSCVDHAGGRAKEDQDTDRARH